MILSTSETNAKMRYGREPQACARDNGRDPGEPAHANGGRLVRRAGGQSANGSADQREYPVGGADHAEN